MSTGTTLYYPFIHPRNTDHLKAALIYWDRVRRIVPHSITHGERVMGDDRDAEMLVDHELLIATRPEPYEDAAALRFFERIGPQISRFRLDPRMVRKLSDRDRGFHIEKFGYSTLQKLRHAGMAEVRDQWVAINQDAGAFYMFCLASEMAEKMSAPLFTDSPSAADVGEAILFSPQAGDAVSDTLVQLGIDLPSPEQLHDVPMKKIVAFAKKRNVERQRFRKAVEDLLTNVKGFTDHNAINDYLSSQRKQIEEAISDLRKTLDELDVGAVSGVAKISVPAGAAAAIAALPFSLEAAAILGAFGIAVSAISTYAETRGKLRQARTSAPFHYLLSMAGDLGIETVPS